MAASMLRLSIALTIVLQVECAKKDCTATAEYPDGTVIERECIVEGDKGARGRDKPRKAKGISEEMAWLKDTRWLWNEWREVIFRADGSFLAPAENCERSGNPKCTWSADEDRIYVRYACRAARALRLASHAFTRVARSCLAVRDRGGIARAQLWRRRPAHAHGHAGPADDLGLARLGRRRRQRAARRLAQASRGLSLLLPALSGWRCISPAACSSRACRKSRYTHATRSNKRNSMNDVGKRRLIRERHDCQCDQRIIPGVTLGRAVRGARRGASMPRVYTTVSTPRVRGGEVAGRGPWAG